MQGRMPRAVQTSGIFGRCKVPCGFSSERRTIRQFLDTRRARAGGLLVFDARRPKLDGTGQVLLGGPSGSVLSADSESDPVIGQVDQGRPRGHGKRSTQVDSPLEGDGFEPSVPREIALRSGSVNRRQTGPPAETGVVRLDPRWRGRRKTISVGEPVPFAKAPDPLAKRR